MGVVFQTYMFTKETSFQQTYFNLMELLAIIILETKACVGVLILRRRRRVTKNDF